MYKKRNFISLLCCGVFVLGGFSSYAAPAPASAPETKAANEVVKVKKYSKAAAKKKHDLVELKEHEYFSPNNGYEGDLTFKVRLIAPIMSSKPKGWSKEANADSKSVPKLFSGGAGGETAIAYSFSPHISAELSAGSMFMNIKPKTLNRVGAAYGSGAKELVGKSSVYMLPVNLIFQYHVAPFGGIRPYMGAGGNGTYMYSKVKSDAMKMSSVFSPVLQAGVDFVAKDDMLVSLELKKYFLRSKASFNKDFLFANTTGSSDVTAKTKLDPLLISIGVGFKF